MAEGQCVLCHSDLNQTERQQPSFAHHIDSFAAHPEFAVLAGADPVKQPVGPQHRLKEVADWSAAQAPWDRAKIKLNHAVHLNKEGIHDGEGAIVRLECISCHTPDGSGYMKPISYKTHCRKCHSSQLVFEQGMAVPHGNAQGAQGFASMLLARKIAKFHADQPGRQADGELLSLDRLLPKLTDSELEQVEAQTAAAARRLFEVDKKGCKYCHTDVQETKGDWKVEAPGIPNIWMPHSRFRHQPHRMLACSVCHAKAAQSELTTDILLPSISTCKECHSGGGPTPSAGAARSHCALCHDYHQHTEEDFNGPLSIQLEKISSENVRDPPGEDYIHQQVPADESSQE